MTSFRVGVNIDAYMMFLCNKSVITSGNRCTLIDSDSPWTGLVVQEQMKRRSFQPGKPSCTSFVQQDMTAPKI